VSAPAGRSLKVVRVVTRGPVFVCLVCLCLADFLLRACLRRFEADSRPQVLQRWNKRLLAQIAVQVSVFGPVPAHGLIVSNHLSYLDIMILSAVADCVFVSKNEVKWWPLVGWIAQLSGTVFVDRGRPSQTNLRQQAMQERLKAGVRVALFPEGTSTDSRELLPFRSSLFEAAVAAGSPITAAYLSYQLAEGDGDPVTDVCYWGDMTLVPHFIKLLTKSYVKATVRFSDAPKLFTDRKQAAVEMQKEVADLENAAKGALPRENQEAFTPSTL